MAQSTISQRIALEGAEDILKQLADLGKAGEDAVKQIQDAASGMSAGLGGLSNFSATIQSGFAGLRTALAPVREEFTALGEAAQAVGEHIVKFSEILGVGLVGGLAGGVAGLVELIKSSAEAGHQLEIQAQVLGLSVEELQVYRKAAVDAGVDADKVFTALSRLAQNVGKDHAKLNDDAIKVLEGLPVAAQQAGVAIVEPFMAAGTGIKSHIVDAISASSDAAKALAPVLLAAIPPDLAKTANIDQLVQQLAQAGTAAGKTGEQFRNAVALLGANFPAQTFGEQLARQAEIAKNPLLAVGVTLKDLQAAGDDFNPIVLKVIDGLSKITDPTQKAQVALALLGRGWREILPAFKDGSAGIAATQKALQDSGFLLTKEQVETLAEAEHAFISLGAAGTGLRNQLAVIFAPALIDITKSFKQLIVDNADTFKAWASVISSQVIPAISNLLGILPKVGEQAKAAGQALPDVISGKTGTGVAQPTAARARLVGPQPGETPIAVNATEIPIATNATAVRLAADQLAAKALSLKAELPIAPTAEVQGPPIPANFVTPGALDMVRNALADAMMKFEGLKKAIENVLSVLTPVTAAVNALFGTEFSNGAIAAIAILGRVSGAFKLLQTASELVLTSIGLLGRGFLTLLPQILPFFGPAGAIVGVAALAAGVVVYRDQITKALEDAQKSLGDFLQSNVGDRINALFANINFEPFRLSFIGVLDGIREALDGFLQHIADFFEITLPGLVAKATALVGGLLGGGGGAPSEGNADFSSGDSPGLGLDSLNAGAPTLAAGGRVPGGPSGTDTVPAWLTPGEFVVRMQAVRHYGTDLLDAVNNMHFSPWDMLRGLQGYSLGGMVGSAMDAFAPSPSPLMLAAGGLALGGGGGSGGAMNSLTLNLSGHSFQLDVAPGHVFDKLARHARTAAVNSAGRKPSWYASR